MKVIHTDEPLVLPMVEIGPLGTMMIFDYDELDIVEKILYGFIAMVTDEDREEFTEEDHEMYDSIEKLHKRVMSNLPDQKN